MHNLCSNLTINPLSAKFIKWSNTLKQIVGKLPTICLSVLDHFSGLAFKGLKLQNEVNDAVLMCLLCTYFSVLLTLKMILFTSSVNLLNLRFQVYSPKSILMLRQKHTKYVAKLRN